MSRAAPDILEDVLVDLRNHQPLVELLPEAAAIYAGHPADDRNFKASVTLTAVSDASTPHRGVMERTVWIQATVTAREDWRSWYDSRDDEPSSVTQMGRILARVGDRLDRSKSTTGGEIPLGGEGGPQPQELDDGRLAMSEDWRVAGWYIDD